MYDLMNDMNRKIFTTDESRIKSDFEFDPYYGWLRSADSNTNVGYVYSDGCIDSINARDYNGILLACMI